MQPAYVQLDNGSGVFITAKGRILTAAHVVRGSNESISTRFSDGHKFAA
ncbi:MAG: hypothetical protein IT427_00410 [Pirellulales bacterium]|nr:hypothetical protein [Pirellulales bacterium]